MPFTCLSGLLHNLQLVLAPGFMVYAWDRARGRKEAGRQKVWCGCRGGREERSWEGWMKHSVCPTMKGLLHPSRLYEEALKAMEWWKAS